MTDHELKVYELTEAIEKLNNTVGMKLVLTRDGYECHSINTKECDSSLDLFDDQSIQQMIILSRSRDPLDLVDWILFETPAWIETAIYVEENYCSADRLEFLRSLL